MDDVLEKQIFPYLKTEFERELFESALFNLKDKNNKLRLNNFAYAARELTRHFLERLAPDEEVRKAPWFKVYDPQKPTMITREQRIKYAIQGYFSDDYTKNKLHVDLTDVSRNLRKSIDDLSKYTHVNEDTFNVGYDTVFELSLNIMEDILRFFMTVTDAQYKVMKAVYSCIDDEMINQFYIETHDEIDTLATHHEVLGYMVTELTPLDKDEATITMKADGVVSVRLQYGSDGDMRRGDGFEMEIQLPFTSEFVADYKNKQGDVHIISAEVHVDNNSFYN